MTLLTVAEALYELPARIVARWHALAAVVAIALALGPEAAAWFAAAKLSQFDERAAVPATIIGLSKGLGLRRTGYWRATIAFDAGGQRCRVDVQVWNADLRVKRGGSLLVMPGKPDPCRSVFLREAFIPRRILHFYTLGSLVLLGLIGGLKLGLDRTRSRA